MDKTEFKNITDNIFKIINRDYEPVIKCRTLKIENDILDFALIKFGSGQRECFYDLHLLNAKKILAKPNKNAAYLKQNLLDTFSSFHIKNKIINTYIIDGMNFVNAAMIFLIKNKNNAEIIKLIANLETINKFYNHINDFNQPEDVIKEISDFTKVEQKVFRLNFLREWFENVNICDEANMYIVYHHGYKHDWNSKERNAKLEYHDFYTNCYMTNNIIMISTILDIGINYVNKDTNVYSGYIPNKYKTMHIKNIQNELNEIVNNRNCSNDVLSSFCNVMSNITNKKNNQIQLPCKVSNETDDYATLITYLYLTEICKVQNVIIVSDDKFGWIKTDAVNNLPLKQSLSILAIKN